MLHNLDAVMKFARREHDDGASGQSNLFGGNHQLVIEERPEESVIERMLMERKVLGTWMSAHPLDLVTPRHKPTNHCRDLEAWHMQGFDRDSRVTLHGYVRSIRERGRITLIAIEDRTGSYEFVMFSDEWARSRHAIHVGGIIAVRFEINMERGPVGVEAFRLGWLTPPPPVE